MSNCKFHDFLSGFKMILEFGQLINRNINKQIIIFYSENRTKSDKNNITKISVANLSPFKSQAYARLRNFFLVLGLSLNFENLKLFEFINYLTI